jgi:hypothetical protein
MTQRYRNDLLWGRVSGNDEREAQAVKVKA